MTTAALVTADEVLQMKDAGFRYALVRGELRKRVRQATGMAESRSI